MSIYSQRFPDFRIAAVTITNDQILNIIASPVMIIPAPGVGKAIIPVSSVVNINLKGGVYSNFSVTTANKKLYLGTGSDLAALGTARSGCLTGSDLNTFFGDATDVEKNLLLGPFSDYNSGFVSLAVRSSLTNRVTKGFLENVPLFLVVKNDPNGNYTGGSPENVLRVKVVYLVYDAVDFD